MATKDFKVPTSVLDEKLPRWKPPPTAAEHYDPKKRCFKGGQEFTRVDKHGNHHPPRGGILPTAPDKPGSRRRG